MSILANHFLGQLIQRFLAHEVPGLAAQLSFYFILAIFPFFIFSFSLLAYLPISTEEVLRFLSQYVPREALPVLETNLRSVLDVKRGELLSLGFIVTLWSSSNGSWAIMHALNRAYDVAEKRNFIHARLVSFFLTFSMAIALAIALLLPVFGKWIGYWLFSLLGFTEAFLKVWSLLRWLISFAVILVIFAYLYFVAPNKKLSLDEVWPGALFATLGWHLVSYLFSYYVSNFGNFSATYGSLGGIIILLFWFYLSGIILILGGEINALLQLKRQKPS